MGKSYFIFGIFLGLTIFTSSYVFAIEPNLENPGVIMKICADDPAFISNAEGHMYDTPLDWFFYWCPEEYENYSPTTRFAVLIHAPAWNTDPDKIDHIGNNGDHPISIYTGLGDVSLDSVDVFGLPCTGFAELGPDTGLFQGLVLLTGFPYDYDGDLIQDTVEPLWAFSDCGSASPFGEIQSAAWLQTEKEGGITVAWQVTDDFTLTKSATYSFREAYVTFDKEVYQLDEQVTVIMNDLDYMLYDEYEFPWIARVWSDSDIAGIEIRVWFVEDTTYATPFFIQSDFYGKFTLTDTDESQFDSRLRVNPGDKIYVEFDDYTLPSPHGDGDYITVSDSADVVFLHENYNGISLTDVKPTNYHGQEIDETKINTPIQIQAQLENLSDYDKTITCILKIQNSNGHDEHISWTMMNLNPNSIQYIDQSWKPKTSGNHTATIYVWEQLTNGIPLTETTTTSFVVLEG